MDNLKRIFEKEIDIIDGCVGDVEYYSSKAFNLGNPYRDIFNSCCDELNYIHQRCLRHCPPQADNTNDVRFIVKVCRGIIERIIEKAFKLTYDLQAVIVENCNDIKNCLNNLEKYAEPLITIDDNILNGSVEERVKITSEFEDLIIKNVPNISIPQLKRHIELIDNCIKNFVDMLTTNTDNAININDVVKAIVNSILNQRMIDFPNNTKVTE